jgi:hypothetical protein
MQLDEGLGCVYKNRVHIFNTYSKLCIKLLSPIVWGYVQYLIYNSY